VKYLTLAAAALPLCVILCSCAAEADTLPVGQWGAVKYGFGTIATACQASSDLDRFHELRASDEMASEVYATEHCVQLVGGTEVFVEKQWFGETCVRPRGTTDCLWIQAIAIWSKATADAFRAQHIDVMTPAQADARRAKLKAADDAEWNREHPRCKNWPDDKDIPDYCLDDSLPIPPHSAKDHAKRQ
jgi:hypothetical protein